MPRDNPIKGSGIGGFDGVGGIAQAERLRRHIARLVAEGNLQALVSLGHTMGEACVLVDDYRKPQLIGFPAVEKKVP